MIHLPTVIYKGVFNERQKRSFPHLFSAALICNNELSLSAGYRICCINEQQPFGLLYFHDLKKRPGYGVRKQGSKITKAVA